MGWSVAKEEEGGIFYYFEKNRETRAKACAGQGRGEDLARATEGEDEGRAASVK
jgi:hypothetical protein